jgi:glycosyltransferase involved in cell wall biosynthesis
MSKLTVIQLLPSLEFGGVERGTLEIADALVKQGHRSIIISAGGRLLPRLQTEGSEHLCIPVGRKSIKSLFLVSKLRRIFHDTGADIIHARSRLPAWLCHLALKNKHITARPAFITTFHGTYSVNQYSSIMGRGDRVIAISEFIREHILKNYPSTNPEKITVIPRGVDPYEFPYGHHPSDAWKKAWYTQHPETKNKTLIAMPARLSRRKGHEDYIAIFKKLSSNPNLHGLIIGGPHKNKQKYLNYLLGLVNDAGLNERITFTGHRNDIREIIVLSSMVLSLSTRPEAFGRTALEALALGVPVIAYDHGGNHEVLKNIYPAGLVPANDKQKTIERILSFLEKPPLVPHDHDFTLHAMQNKTLSLYESVVYG